MKHSKRINRPTNLSIHPSTGTCEFFRITHLPARKPEILCRLFSKRRASAPFLYCNILDIFLQLALFLFVFVCPNWHPLFFFTWREMVTNIFVFCLFYFKRIPGAGGESEFRCFSDQFRTTYPCAVVFNSHANAGDLVLLYFESWTTFHIKLRDATVAIVSLSRISFVP